MYGLDIHKAIIDNIYENTNDYAHETFKLPGYVEELISKGSLGSKTSIGLYKIKEKQVYDLQTKQYREQKEYHIPFINKVIEKFKIGDYKEGITEIIKDTSREAIICKEFLSDYIIYAIKVSMEVADKVSDCEIAMAEGFNWIPPYSLIQLIGKDECEKMILENTRVDKDTIQKIFNSNLESQYKYEKFLKAKR